MENGVNERTGVYAGDLEELYKKAVLSAQWVREVIIRGDYERDPSHFDIIMNEGIELYTYLIEIKVWEKWDKYQRSSVYSAIRSTLHSLQDGMDGEDLGKYSSLVKKRLDLLREMKEFLEDSFMKSSSTLSESLREKLISKVTHILSTWDFNECTEVEIESGRMRITIVKLSCGEED